jgi:nondiscriminating glutamyl-tRNA synthetase
VTVRTRFAPSPTGALHLGNIRAAVFNWLFTRHEQGSFVLRLEDTDIERNVAGAEDSLMHDLRWLGLEWDEGPDIGGPHAPYRQSERAGAYRAAAARLLELGTAYRCFCDEDEAQPQELDRNDPGFRRYSGRCRALSADEARTRAEAGEPFAVRLRTPAEGEIEVDDAVRGTICAPAADLDDFVLLRRDGRPTYNFAVVVDDIDMKITHVIRGSGHLSNTPKQALLFDAFGAPRPVFAHLAQVLDPEGGKLSKRAGATSVAEYREHGCLPKAIMNYVSLLGWSHPDEQEVLEVDELIRTASLERLGASDTALDPEKLRWVGAQHLARLSAAEVAAGVAPFLDRPDSPAASWTAEQRSEAIETLRSRLSCFGDIEHHLHFFVMDAELWQTHRDEVVAVESCGPVLQALAQHLPAVHWNSVDLKSTLKQVSSETGARGPALYHPVRWALTGRTDGPDLSRIAFVIGRESALDRVNAALRACASER